MGISDKTGSIAKGKIANLFITKEIPGYEFMPYSYGSNNIRGIFFLMDIIYYACFKDISILKIIFMQLLSFDRLI